MTLFDPEGEDHGPSPWPVATIDFEASSLLWGSYPIEVGMAIWRAPD